MDFFDLLKMVGGLALFLYGMNLLGDGLSQASGGRLERILEKLTSNPIKAVLMGAVVTGVIQSSSATTVMVVGFVNSGIMSLKQAVGIIMGANIGTTVTSWILSLAGIESDAFWIRMLKPSSFSPILAIVGVGILLFSHKDKLKNAATILVGFAILMFGMDSMSAAVSPLAEVPEFTNLLIKFQNPVFGVLAGLVLTAVIQSSSASVGILQALCMTGAVSFGAAVPIIMGQNIGTCVTAMISGIGASRNAKRAALIHLYFNIIGTILFLGIFYTANAIHPFAFLGEVATQVHRLAAVFWDVNNLKYVNDKYGHAAGDVLIQTLSSVLYELSTDRRKVYRVGGDEFVMIIENPVDFEIESMVESVSAALLERDGQGDIPISSAVGWAEGCGVDIRKIVNEADTKMYENKKRGKEGRE